MSDPVSKPAQPQIPIALSHPAPAWRRALLLASLCAALALVSASSSVHEAVLDVLRACQDVMAEHPVAGPGVFILFAAISAMLAFVSVAVLVPIAVFAWGPLLAILYLWLGWVTGGVMSYVFGRFVGRSLLLWLSPAATTRLEHLVSANASLGLALLLQLSLPSELLGYALGSARFAARKYVVVLLLGELPYAIGAVVLGASFVERRPVTLIVGGIIIGGLIVLAFTILRRRVALIASPAALLTETPALRTGTHP
jgi:uncharacterized membrane protein YdjX (TVP38/TMEM64 family)